jgi:MFS family permease
MSAQELSPDVLPVAADARLETVDGRPRVSYRIAFPYFGWMYRPLVARRARRIERAAEAGEPLPDGRPWWGPPDHLDERAQTTIAVCALLTAIYAYGGGTLGLLSLTLPAAADTYSANDDALAVGLAVVRIGVLLALLAGTLADRIGRRTVIVWAAIAHCVITAVIGLSPTLELYIGGHTVLRFVDTLLAIGLGIIVLEQVSAGARAVGLALLTAAGGIGLGLAALALPLAQSGRAGFALAYGLQLLAIPLVLDAARRLPESPRFIRHAEERHGYREVLRGVHLRRLALLGGTSMLAAAFVAPALEFLTQYLDDEVRLTPGASVVLLGVMGVAAGPGLMLGAGVADVVGRRPVAIPAFTAAFTAIIAFYLVGEQPWVWLLAPAFAFFGAAGGSAVGPYGSELFPTRMRSSAQTLILVLTVLGSAIGLLVVGTLSNSIETSEAIALAGIGPAIAIAIFAAFLPETARRELEETSGDTT